jgi:hypothetical protein
LFPLIKIHGEIKMALGGLYGSGGESSRRPRRSDAATPQNKGKYHARSDRTDGQPKSTHENDSSDDEKKYTSGGVAGHLIQTNDGDGGEDNDMVVYSGGSKHKKGANEWLDKLTEVLKSGLPAVAGFSAKKLTEANTKPIIEKNDQFIQTTVKSIMEITSDWIPGIPYKDAHIEPRQTRHNLRDLIKQYEKYRDENAQLNAAPAIVQTTTMATTMQAMQLSSSGKATDKSTKAYIDGLKKDQQIKDLTATVNRLRTDRDRLRGERDNAQDKADGQEVVNEVLAQAMNEILSQETRESINARAGEIFGAREARNPRH